jgi:hypothetical protein
MGCQRSRGKGGPEEFPILSTSKVEKTDTEKPPTRELEMVRASHRSDYDAVEPLVVLETAKLL